MLKAAPRRRQTLRANRLAGICRDEGAIGDRLPRVGSRSRSRFEWNIVMFDLSVSGARTHAPDIERCRQNHRNSRWPAAIRHSRCTKTATDYAGEHVFNHRMAGGAIPTLVSSSYLIG